MQLCATCSSVIDDPVATSSHTEKLVSASQPVLLPCGAHSICVSCQRRNPRWTTQCLLCGTVQDVLAAKVDVSAAGFADRSQDYDDFILGEDDDDDEDPDCDEFNEKNLYSVQHSEATASPPPPPSDDHGIDDGYWSKETAQFDGEEEGPPAYDERAETSANTAVSQHAKDTKTSTPSSSDQPQIHYIAPTDTLLGLSLRYKIDGKVLCRTNRLPLSTLSTTPQLLHTLPFILLPPGSGPSTSSQPLRSPEQERRRLVVRRFQLHTKCADWAMAKAYCDAVFVKRDKEAEYVRQNAQNRRGASDATGETPEATGSCVDVRQGGELEEAIEMYELDERWERQQKGKMGSRLKSSGQVESQVKGWSWPR